jgi:hypothetical protein
MMMCIITGLSSRAISNSKGGGRSEDDDLCPCDLRRIEDEEEVDENEDCILRDDLVKGPYGLPTEALIPKIPTICEPPLGTSIATPSINYSTSILKVTATEPQHLNNHKQQHVPQTRTFSKDAGPAIGVGSFSNS